MIKGAINSSLQNKNSIMFTTAIIFMCGILACFNDNGILCSAIITVLAIFAIIPMGDNTLGGVINISKKINLGNIGGVIFFALLCASLVAFINKKEKKTK